METQFLSEPILSTQIDEPSDITFATILDLCDIGVALFQIDKGKFVYTNIYLEGLLGWGNDENGWLEFSKLCSSRYPFTKDEIKKNIFKAIAGEHLSFDWQISKKGGEAIWVSIAIKPISIWCQKFVLMTIREITHYKHLEKEVQVQINHIQELKAIDSCINNEKNIDEMFSRILDHIGYILDVESAAILTYTLSDNTLKVAANIGFPRFHYQSKNEVEKGELAWEVIYTKEKVIYPERTKFHQSPHYFLNEGFISYIGFPLIVQDRVLGVLEIYKRSHIDPSPNWDQLLETLAGQTVIAVEKAQMLNEIKKAEIEVLNAYDATIICWSQSLEYKDKETRGHSDRVVNMSLKVAQKVGLEGDQLVHFRRGVLLHDIGKMGIPDSILLKPGPLNNEEWEIMRRHPTIGMNMIKDIPFLKPALYIPYHHHEKWDGTGYPCGLKGEDIPLMARIFSVVDVWDALRYDRPYRKALSEKDVCQYLLDQSGRHFDPEIVRQFLEFIDQDE